MTYILLDENNTGRDFVVGDIHGCFESLDGALATVDFDPEKDRLISIGDLIDRGPQSEQCLEFLNRPYTYTIRGNHEDMFLQLYASGDLERYVSGTLDAAMYMRLSMNGLGWIQDISKAEIESMYEAFKALPIAIEIPTIRGSVGFVHAEVPAGLDWQDFIGRIQAGDQSLIQEALWGRKRIKANDQSGVEGIDRIFLGHTPQKEGVKRLGNCYYVDTGCVFDHRDDGDSPCGLTIADIRAKTVIFATEDESGIDGHINAVTQITDEPFGDYAGPSHSEPKPIRF